VLTQSGASLLDAACAACELGTSAVRISWYVQHKLAVVLALLHQSQTLTCHVCPITCAL
jgi:hypothetical protein